MHKIFAKMNFFKNIIIAPHVQSHTDKCHKNSEALSGLHQNLIVRRKKGACKIINSLRCGTIVTIGFAKFLYPTTIVR
jgi:hypothetical protein